MKLIAVVNEKMYKISAWQVWSISQHINFNISVANLQNSNTAQMISVGEA